MWWGLRGPQWGMTNHVRTTRHKPSPSTHIGVLSMTTESFDFKFTRGHRVASAFFGVTPKNCRLTVTDQEVEVKYGPWHFSVPLSNVLEVKPTGPYAFIKTAGPPHLSLSDGGVTFATNSERGLCIRFHEPVRGIGPGGRPRHTGMTVTVADIERLEKTLIG
jgi:hypothetical protein